MPNVTATPAQLEWTGGGLMVEPVRFTVTPGAASWTGGFILAGPGFGTSLVAIDLGKLARLFQATPIVLTGGQPTQQFQRQYQSAMEAIEATVNAITSAVNDNTALLAEIKAAQTLAATANDNATAVRNQTLLSGSYVNPTTPVTATNDGTVTIAAHTRVYSQTESALVNAGSLSGYASGAYVTVYYEDAARAGGNVAYKGSTGAVAQQDSVHVVGQVVIPAAGEVAATGTGTSASGYAIPPEYALEYQDFYSIFV